MYSSVSVYSLTIVRFSSVLGSLDHSGSLGDLFDLRGGDPIAVQQCQQ